MAGQSYVTFWKIFVFLPLLYPVLDRSLSPGKENVHIPMFILNICKIHSHIYNWNLELDRRRRKWRAFSSRMSSLLRRMEKVTEVLKSYSRHFAWYLFSKCLMRTQLYSGLSPLSLNWHLEFYLKNHTTSKHFLYDIDYLLLL